jgi:Mrp family chromosome partitioning ATPase
MLWCIAFLCRQQDGHPINCQGDRAAVFVFERKGGGVSKIITASNRLGGVAKTTTTVTLGHGLALKGKSVLLVGASDYVITMVWYGLVT